MGVAIIIPLSPGVINLTWTKQCIPLSLILNSQFAIFYKNDKISWLFQLGPVSQKLLSKIGYDDCYKLQKSLHLLAMSRFVIVLWQFLLTTFMKRGPDSKR